MSYGSAEQARDLGALAGDDVNMGYVVRDWLPSDGWWHFRIFERALAQQDLKARMTLQAPAELSCAVSVLWGTVSGDYRLESGRSLSVVLTAVDVERHDDSHDAYVGLVCETVSASACDGRRTIEVHSSATATIRRGDVLLAD